MSEGPENENTLIVMVGLPRSGKSTWARERNLPIVSSDAIRLALHGHRFIGLAEPLVWVLAHLMVRALFLAGNNRVIVDGCHVKREYRDEWAADRIVTEWNVVFKHIYTGMDICLSRAKAENDEEIIPIIRKMENEFEPLGAGENQLGGPLQDVSGSTLTEVGH